MSLGVWFPIFRRNVATKVSKPRIQTYSVISNTIWMLIKTAVSISGTCYCDVVCAVGWELKLIINHWESIMYPSLRAVVGWSWRTYRGWEANLLLVGKLVNIHCIEPCCVDKNWKCTTHSNTFYEGDVLKFLSHVMKGQSCPCARLQGLPGSRVATVVARWRWAVRFTSGPLVGRDSSLATGWTVRGSNPGGGEIFRKRPDRLWGEPSLLYVGSGVFPGVKGSGRGVSHPPSYSAEVKERVDLYLYSTSGSYVPCYGVNFTRAD